MSFDVFLRQLSETNSTLSGFVDFDKVAANVDEIEIKLNQLNYLIGKKDLSDAVNKLFKENESCFSILKILIAVRDNKKILNELNTAVDLDSYFSEPDSILSYLDETGLSEVLKNKKIKNLVDYVFGIEVGLDSNARKNRGGSRMENVIASAMDNAGIKYKKEVYSEEYTELSILGKDQKRFDFVVESAVKKYLIEVNYYNSGGSKLNETARAYSEIGPKINSLDGFEFVWITDGKGWLKAKNKLEEAFLVIPSLYNLRTLEQFVHKVKSE